MQQALLTVDLGFGDAGKGTIVDALTRTYEAHTVVRYSGGAQAGHRVVTSGTQPQAHVFAQFGSGTLAGAATHLSRFMLLDPLAMVAEEQHLRTLGVTDAFARTTIDQRALVVTPFQRAVNRLKELSRGAARHGSCGMGIGETMADYLEHGERVLFAGDLRNPASLRTKLSFLHALNLAKARKLTVPDSEHSMREWRLLLADDWRTWLLEAYRDFAKSTQIVSGNDLHTILQRPGTVIFEAAQGVLLDEWVGFHPYTTWSTTTLEHAEQLLDEASYRGGRTRIGITRAYATRHGAGPLVTEDTDLTQTLPDPCNEFGAWQQGFRVGWLDMLMLRYAIEATGPLDYLAVTCLDRLAALPALQVCRRYSYDTFTIDRVARVAHPRSLEYQEQITRNLARCHPLLEPVSEPQALLELLERELDLPIGIVSRGPRAEDKQFR